MNFEIFFQDNCSIHTANDVKRWFQDHSNAIELLPWPVKAPGATVDTLVIIDHDMSENVYPLINIFSSDLNPIENLWGQIVTAWEGETPRQQEPLLAHVRAEWERMRGRPTWVANTCGNMRRRLQMVLDAEGEWIKY